MLRRKGRGMDLRRPPAAALLLAATYLVVAVSGAEVARIRRSPAGGETEADGFIDIRMPGASPNVEDAYMCTPKVTTFDEDVYITKFEPLGTSADRVHHMLIFGCPEGANRKSMWDCGHHGVCPNSKILFAWAKNAPPANLPQDVGFRIPRGGVIVVQIHYARALGKEGISDDSGIRLHVTSEKPRYLGGIYLMVAGMNIRIPAHKQNVTADVNCYSKSDAPIYVFGFRTHAHELGTVITGYKYYPKVAKYELFAKGNPQWPQAFYPISPPFEILPKDIIAARCVYDSSKKDVYTGVGMTGKDEMCNLYMMFYTDVDKGEDFFQCLDDELPLPPLPVSSLVPPPKNAQLESYAMGKMGHAGHALAPVKYELAAKTKTDDVKANTIAADAGGPIPSSAAGKTLEPGNGADAVGGAIRPEDYPVPGISLRQYYSNSVFDPSMNVLDNQVEKTGWDDLSPEAREYHSVPGWPMLERGLRMGQVSAVSMTEGGTLVVFHRGDRVWDQTTFDRTARLKHPQLGPIKADTVLYLNPDDGSLIGSWGKNTFYMPHGLTVDHEDNVWLTDVGMHQVFKYSQSGRKLLELGKHLEPGSDERHFCKPTSVAVDPKTGNFFVADGYCNSRVLKFSADGSRLLLQVGKVGNTLMGMFGSWSHRPGPFDLSVPHALALDSERNLLFVADRENGRVQAYTSGNVSYVGTIASRRFGGRLFSVAYTPAFGGLLYAVNGPNGGDGPVQGFVVSPRAKTKKQVIAATFGASEFREPHDILVTADANEVFVAETTPPRLWKFVRGDLGKLQKQLQASRLVEKPQVEELKPSEKAASGAGGGGSSSSSAGSVPSSEAGRLPSASPQEQPAGDRIRDGRRFSWPVEILLVAAVPLLVLGLIIVVLRLRKRSNVRAVYQTYKHTGPDKYGFGGILGRGRRGGGGGAGGSKDGFERLDTTGSDGEDDLFVSAKLRTPRGSGASGNGAMSFSLDDDDDDDSSSDSDAEVFSRQTGVTTAGAGSASKSSSRTAKA